MAGPLQRRKSQVAARTVTTVFPVVRRFGPDETDVFCGTNTARTRTLFATEHFYVIPSIKPLSQGHLLVISKRHFPCFGAVPARWEAEYNEVLQISRGFIRDTYGRETMIWENGGPAARQSVHHAHLQVIPIPDGSPDLPPRGDAVIADGYKTVRRIWNPMRRLDVRTAMRSVNVSSTVKVKRAAQIAGFPWARRGYHYVEFRGDRRAMAANASDVYPILVWQTIHLNIPVSPDGTRWDRVENLPSVMQTVADFRVWERAQPQLGLRGAA